MKYKNKEFLKQYLNGGPTKSSAAIQDNINYVEPLDINLISRKQIPFHNPEQDQLINDNRTALQKKQDVERTNKINNPDFITEVAEGNQNILRYMANPFKLPGDIATVINDDSYLSQLLPNTTEDRFEHRKMLNNPKLNTSKITNNVIDESVRLGTNALINTSTAELGFALPKSMTTTGLENLFKEGSKAGLAADILQLSQTDFNKISEGDLNEIADVILNTASMGLKLDNFDASQVYSRIRNWKNLNNSDKKDVIKDVANIGNSLYNQTQRKDENMKTQYKKSKYGNNYSLGGILKDAGKMFLNSAATPFETISGVDFYKPEFENDTMSKLNDVNTNISKIGTNIGATALLGPMGPAALQATSTIGQSLTANGAPQQLANGGDLKKAFNPELASDPEFQKWYSNNTIEGKRGVPYSQDFDYDYLSFYMNGEHKDSRYSIENHFPDRYKRVNHPTFSNESIYSTPENPGGQWEGENYNPNGKFVYANGGYMKPYAVGGQLTEFQNGGSHEQNPNGGIPVGQNALVEQGETMDKQFVFSDRLKINKTLAKEFSLPNKAIGKTFAEVSKMFNDESRPNDQISKKGYTKEVENLKQAQEAFKQVSGIDKPQGNQMALGGDLSDMQITTLSQIYPPEKVQQLIQMFKSKNIDPGSLDNNSILELANSFMNDPKLSTNITNFATTPGSKFVKDQSSLNANRVMPSDLNDAEYIPNPADLRAANEAIKKRNYIPNTQEVDVSDAEYINTRNYNIGGRQPLNPYNPAVNSQDRSMNIVNSIYANSNQVQTPAQAQVTAANNAVTQKQNNTQATPQTTTQAKTPVNQDPIQPYSADLLSKGVQPQQPAGPLLPYGADLLAGNPNQQLSKSNQPSGPSMANGNFLSGTSNQSNKTLGDMEDYSSLLRFAPVATEAFNLARIANNKPAAKNTSMFNTNQVFDPNLVNAEQINRDIETQGNANRDMIRNTSGGNQASLMSNLLASQLQTDQAIGQSNIQVDSINNQELARIQGLDYNQAQSNTGKQMQVQDWNDRDLGAWNNSLMQGISTMGQNIGNVGVDSMNRNMAKDLPIQYFMNLLGKTNYKGAQ